LKALLALADGRVFEGRSFGATGEVVGELVFNTSMTGYQEILTDPSYEGQMVVMTYPLIGNYGINSEDFESSKPWVRAFVVKENCSAPVNWRSEISLDQFLKKHGIVGIEGVDTRAVTIQIREKGAQEAVISTIDLDSASLIKKARQSTGLVGKDLVQNVTCSERYSWNESTWKLGNGYAKINSSCSKYKVVAYDFGVKRNILRMLVEKGCDVTVVPAYAKADEVLSMNPDGIFLSNGPGDPEGAPSVIENVKQLIGKKPIFGICLGHQLLCLALGAKSFKLRFGHRGGNQPVINLDTKKVEITCQNHGFSIFKDSLPECLEPTHINLNDETLEGVRHKTLPIFSVQYHPESSPGPHDAEYLFENFLNMMSSGAFLNV